MEARTAATLHPHATTSHQRHGPHPSVEPVVRLPDPAPPDQGGHPGPQHSTSSRQPGCSACSPASSNHAGLTARARRFLPWPCILGICLGPRPGRPATSCPLLSLGSAQHPRSAAGRFGYSASPAEATSAEAPPRPLHLVVGRPARSYARAGTSADALSPLTISHTASATCCRARTAFKAK